MSTLQLARAVDNELLGVWVPNGNVLELEPLTHWELLVVRFGVCIVYAYALVHCTLTSFVIAANVVSDKIYLLTDEVNTLSIVTGE